uniref:Uncharacterized protein LOC114343927 n=1 Tax=Diabrotica virgifera virgifera TaxID=50390 RepID=A0A6P7GLM6_DIAVI
MTHPVYDHYSSTDKNPLHQKCPIGEKSWCEWQRAAATKELKNFKHTYTALLNDVLEAIKPIYENLSSDALLERCVGGFTQNNNESVNQLIWKISPKILSGTSNLVEIAANVDVSTFNEGSFALLTFMESMGINLGASSHEWAHLEDDQRISGAYQKAANESKEGRDLRRQQQTDALDILADGPSLYGPEIDDSI